MKFWIYLTAYVLCCSFASAETLRGALLLPPPTVAQTVNTTSYKLLISSGEKITISPVKRLKNRFNKLAGNIVSIKVTTKGKQGKYIGKTISLDTNPFQIEEAKRIDSKIAFILVGFPGLAPSVSANELIKIIEQGRAPYAGSLLQIFRLSSSNTFNLQYSLENIYGPVVVENKSGENCEKSYRNWSDRAIVAAQNLGLKANRYDHLVFIFPNAESFNCPVSGRGELFGPVSWLYKVTPNSLAHEIGHNLGFFHSGRADGVGLEKFLGDYSSPMSAANPNSVMFNAANLVQNGWLNVKDGTLRELSAGTDEEILLRPLETETLLAGEYKALRLSPSNGSAPYILSYRMASNPESNSLASEYSRGLSIHRDYGLGRTTYFIASLRDGEHFVDTRYGLKITQISHGNNGAKIRVTISSGSNTKLCYRYDPCSVFGRSIVAKNCSGKEISVAAMDSSMCPILDPASDRDANTLADGSDPDFDYDGDGYPNSIDCSTEDPTIYRNLKFIDSDYDNVSEGISSSPVCGTDFGLNGYTAFATTDNCIGTFNPSQEDEDLNGVGNVCDASHASINIEAKYNLLRNQLLSSAKTLSRIEGNALFSSAVKATSWIGELILDSQYAGFLNPDQVNALQTFQNAARKYIKTKNISKKVIKSLILVFS